MTVTVVARRVIRRPRVGDMVETRYGTARVLGVERYGVRLHVQTDVHGRTHIERARAGHWTVVGHAEVGDETSCRYCDTDLVWTDYDGYARAAWDVADGGDSRACRVSPTGEHAAIPDPYYGTVRDHSPFAPPGGAPPTD